MREDERGGDRSREEESGRERTKEDEKQETTGKVGYVVLQLVGGLATLA